MVNEKLSEYKANLKTKKIFMVDNQAIPLFKSTVEKNIYKSDTLLKYFEDPCSEILLDMDQDYFLAILDIVKKGHNFFSLDEEDKADMVRKFKLRSKHLERDEIFNNLIKLHFPDPNVFSAVVVDFNLNFKSVPKDLIGLVIGVSNDSVMTHLDKHTMKTQEDFDLFTDSKNKKAIFLDYNKQAIVELKNPVRIKQIGLKPFTADTNAFYPTTGAYYPKFHISMNNVDWEYIGIMPSTWGSSNDDYLTTFNLGGFKSFKYIKFNTDSSSQFSVSYIKLD